MPEFFSPVDIGNCTCQHCGVPRMDATLGFAEGSQRANEISFRYGKKRRAELQRNAWTFATRKAALRPLDINTRLLAPTLWQSDATYFAGSIVSDSVGTLWESTMPSNSGNQPGLNANGFLGPGWEPYFGPMTAEPFDSSKDYFRGELVYTFAGDGTINVFESRADGNAVHPALPNQWSFDTVYKTNDVVQQFPAWASGTTYSQGQGALYTDGNVYVSLTNGNLDNIPPSSPQWVALPTLTLTSQLMPSNIFSAPTEPGTTPIDEWQIETTYSLGSFAIFKATVYMSTANGNVGNFPGVSNWVAVSGGTLYQSLVDLNIGNSPGSSPTQWTTSLGGGGGNSLWLQIGGAAFSAGVGLNIPSMNWPIGSGPLSQNWTKNVYRLPANYLKRAPQDPAAGRISWLGVPSNLPATDWVIQGSYLVSADGMPIVLRFIADVQNVTEFPDLFGEMLGCSIAEEVCEILTQSTAKLAAIASAYREKRSEAIAQNMIEQGPIPPPLDDLILCRA